MAAGTHYDLNPEYKPQEFYRVESGVRKSGPWKLDTTNLSAGAVLPVFTPVQADVETRTFVPVRNVRVAEAYADGTELKIEKSPLVYVGMFLGNGKNGAQVAAVDTSNKNYDLITLSAAFGAALAEGTVLFEATAAGGTKKKNTANFVTFDEKKVDLGGTFITLLMQAYEIKESKLPVPIHELDKEGLTSRFQFDY
jgi:hypothetical protein